MKPIPRRVLAFSAIAVAGAVVVFLLWKGPDLLLQGVVRGHHDPISAKEYAGLLDDYRKTMAQIIGGIGLVFTLLFSWKTYLLSARTTITDRFAQSVELLGSLDKNGSPAWEPRMGGAYALGEIARESPSDYRIIVEILATYLRHYAHCPKADLRNPKGQPKVWDHKELQAILTIIGRRDADREDNTPLVILSHLDLRSAALNGARLERLDLRNVNFSNANLHGATFNLSHLNNSVMTKANLMAADFGSCFLDGVDFGGANLNSAVLSKSYVTQEQLESAEGNSLTELPSGRTRPKHWK